jgi:hypothetical protein
VKQKISAVDVLEGGDQSSTRLAVGMETNWLRQSHHGAWISIPGPAQ